MVETMIEKPLASIIINNYNYGRFLTSAIESSLAQTYPKLEIIVVDDGSSDNSREIIASYKDWLTPLIKENGGQASALNAGFQAGKGDIILFLDADDMLMPSTVERVAEVFEKDPGIVKVQYLLEVIDESGKSMGKVMPPRPLSSGDLRMRVLKYYSYSSPPTSGNAFRSHILRRLFPIPEKEYRIGADMYLSDLSVLLGPVASINSIGGYYREHGRNYYSLARKRFGDPEDLNRLRGFLHRMEIGFNYQQTLARELSIVAEPRKLFETWDRLSAKMTSLKLDPGHHPYEGDSAFGIALKGMRAAMTEPGFLLHQRALHALWFTGMLMLPQHYARFLAEKLYRPEQRGRTWQWFRVFREKHLFRRVP